MVGLVASGTDWDLCHQVACHPLACRGMGRACQFLYRLEFHTSVLCLCCVTTCLHQHFIVNELTVWVAIFILAPLLEMYCNTCVKCSCTY